MPDTTLDTTPNYLDPAIVTQATLELKEALSESQEENQAALDTFNQSFGVSLTLEDLESLKSIEDSQDSIMEHRLFYESRFLIGYRSSSKGRPSIENLDFFADKPDSLKLEPFFNKFMTQCIEKHISEETIEAGRWQKIVEHFIAKPRNDDGQLTLPAKVMLARLHRCLKTDTFYHGYLEFILDRSIYPALKPELQKTLMIYHVYRKINPFKTQISDTVKYGELYTVPQAANDFERFVFNKCDSNNQPSQEKHLFLNMFEQLERTMTRQQALHLIKKVFRDRPHDLHQESTFKNAILCCIINSHAMDWVDSSIYNKGGQSYTSLLTDSPIFGDQTLHDLVKTAVKYKRLHDVIINIKAWLFPDSRYDSLSVESYKIYESATRRIKEHLIDNKPDLQPISMSMFGFYSSTCMESRIQKVEGLLQGLKQEDKADLANRGIEIPGYDQVISAPR